MSQTIHGIYRKCWCILFGFRAVVWDKILLDIKELSEGIQASGSVAKDAGYDLENYTALLGALIAKTRQSGSELGRSLRTMFVRTTKASSALAGGEVTEDDLSNAEAALGRVGVKVRSDLETFRSFDEIMGDLYEEVDSLSEVDLSNIAYEVASTRQTNVFKMMIKAYGDYQGMAEKAANADGITLANQEKYAESIKGRLGELQAISESFWNNMLNSDALKLEIDSLTTILKLLDGISKTFGSLGTIGIGAGIFAGFKNFGRRRQMSPPLTKDADNYMCFIRILIFHIISSEMHCCKTKPQYVGNSYTVWYSPQGSKNPCTGTVRRDRSIMDKPSQSDNRW